MYSIFFLMTLRAWRSFHWRSQKTHLQFVGFQLLLSWLDWWTINETAISSVDVWSKDGSNDRICQSINKAAYEWALKNASPLATWRWLEISNHIQPPSNTAATTSFSLNQPFGWLKSWWGIKSFPEVWSTASICGGQPLGWEEITAVDHGGPDNWKPTFANKNVFSVFFWY